MKKAFLLFLFLTSLITTLCAQINEQYVVTAKTINMRSGEGKEHNIITTLAQNDEVRVLQTSQSSWWNVDFNGTQGFVLAQFLQKRSNDGWVVQKYGTGDTPECEKVNPQHDYKLNNYLKVVVNTNTDVLLKLMKKNADGDVCIRTVYIESHDFLLLKNIPEGKYYLKIAYGNDWRQKKMGGKCQGMFRENALYEIGKQQLNYNVIQLNDRIEIPSYGLSLGVKAKDGVDATFTSTKITQEEFNE